MDGNYIRMYAYSTIRTRQRDLDALYTWVAAEEVEEIGYYVETQTFRIGTLIINVNKEGCSSKIS